MGVGWILALIAAMSTIVVTAAAVALSRSAAATAESAALAEAFGLQAVSGRKVRFYSGTFAGHNVALAHVFASQNLRGADARRTGEWRLRLLVGLNRETPLGASVNRAFDEALRSELSGDFEADFRTRNPGVIGPEARASLVAFARAHEHVSLMDRGDPATVKFLGAPVLSSSPTVLVHDEPGLGQSADDIRRLWDAMIAAVAPMEAR